MAQFPELATATFLKHLRAKATAATRCRGGGRVDLMLAISVVCSLVLLGAVTSGQR